MQNFVFVSAIVTSLLFLFVAAFATEITNVLSVFIAPFPMLAIGLAFVISLISSIAFVVRKQRYRSLRAFVPLLIHVVAIAIALTVPFTEIKIDLDWRMNLNRRIEVVRMIEEGELKPESEETPNLISLPRGYRRTSKGGGKVLVERKGDATCVIFYFYRGILGHFSGFMYRSDDSQPEDGDFGGERIHFQKQQEHWYWITAGDR